MLHQFLLSLVWLEHGIRIVYCNHDSVNYDGDFVELFAGAVLVAMVEGTWEFFEISFLLGSIVVVKEFAPLMF